VDIFISLTSIAEPLPKGSRQETSDDNRMDFIDIGEFFLKTSITLLSLNMSHPIGGRPRIYNAQERNQIDPYKDDYLKTTSPGERKALAKGKIFPTLFTYWSSIGVDLTPHEMKIREAVSLISKQCIICCNGSKIPGTFEMVTEFLAHKEDFHQDHV
jgi:hypothetical protein